MTMAKPAEIRPRQQFPPLGNVRQEHPLEQIVGHSRRYHQQQPGRRRQRRGDPPRRHQRDHPVRQRGDLRISQYDDVPVHLQLVAVPAECLRLGGELRVLVVVVLDAPVAVAIVERQQPCPLPGPEPFRPFLVEQVAVRGADRAGLDGLHQVQPCHGADGGRGKIQDADEKQRPAGRVTGIADLGHGEETAR